MSFYERLAVAFARESENLIPSDFYDVRQEIKPKAGWFPMYVLAGLAYVGCIIAFACIFVSESQKSYTDTQIFSYDNSGNDGYTCQMISKVTASYEVKSKQAVTLSYQLINVIESKSDFEGDMQAADPCAHQLAYFPGTAVSPYDGAIVSYGAVALYESDMALVIPVLFQQPSIYFYNYSIGSYIEYKPHAGIVVNSIAAGNNNGVAAVYMCNTDAGDRFIVYKAQLTSTGSVIETYLGDFTTDYRETTFLPRIINDNLYNIYIMKNDTILAVNVYASLPAAMWPVFRLSEGTFYRAAVFNSTQGGGLKVYYIDNAKSCYVWSQADGSVQDLNCAQGTVDLVVDGQDQVFYLQKLGNNNFAVMNTTSALRIVTSNGPPLGFDVTDRGDRVGITLRGPATSTDQLAFLYDMPTPDVSAQPQLVQSVSQFGAGYFTCDDQLLTTAQYTPGQSESYPQACRSNGVVGKVVFAEQYLFTTQDATTYALQHAPSHCTGLYPVIADTISDLPPYSCSRTVHPSFLACMATAAANTQLVFQIFVFFSAILLIRLAPRFPAKEVAYRGSAPPSATPVSVEMSTKQGNGGVSKMDQYGAYGGHDIENPMAEQS